MPNKLYIFRQYNVYFFSFLYSFMLQESVQYMLEIWEEKICPCIQYYMVVDRKEITDQG